MSAQVSPVRPVKELAIGATQLGLPVADVSRWLPSSSLHQPCINVFKANVYQTDKAYFENFRSAPISVYITVSTVGFASCFI